MGKENEARLIDNRIPSGALLQLMQTTAARLGAIELVSQDIEALFAGRLQKTDIEEARHAERLGFEVFEINPDDHKARKARQAACPPSTVCAD